MEARRTGIFCAIQEDALGAIDLVGNGFNVYQDYEVLSHRVEQVVTPGDAGAVGTGIRVDGSSMIIEGTNAAALAALATPIIVGKFLHASLAD